MSAFDNQLYVKLQAEKILERIKYFNNKLYLEFGGKIFDDYHASRVLPGFEIDSKVKMLFELKDNVEIVIAINAKDIQNAKFRGDFGITYEEETMRMIDSFKKMGLYVGSVVVTQYNNEPSVIPFKRKLKYLGIPVFFHYPIAGYPTNIDKIVSEEGYGKNDYIITSRSLIVVTAPGPGSGKMATCLSQLYHENKRGITAGYAKYETFPIWNLPLKHPVNLAYESATADLDDVNMIDPFHLNAYNEMAVNYNRDVEIFPVLEALFKRIYGKSPYQSPTDMGVNMIGFCIIDQEKVEKACKQEVIRRYYEALNNVRYGRGTEEQVGKIQLIMSQIGTTIEDRKTVSASLTKAGKSNRNVVAIELADGTIITGKSSELLSATSAAIINCIKYLAGISDKLKLISPNVIEPIQRLKGQMLNYDQLRLEASDMLIALSITATTNPIVEVALSMLPQLSNAEAHSTVILSYDDLQVLKKLNVHVTCEPIVK